ncbi:MAG: type II secretion system protein GspM [Hyphomicrobiaceae bacterium]
MAPVPHFRAALGLAGLVILAFAALAVAPFIWSQTLSTKQGLALQELRLAQRRAASIAASPTDDATGNQAGFEDALLLPGSTDGIAAAALQARLSEAASRHGGTVDVLRSVPVKPDGSLIRIGVTMSLQTKVAGLQAMLHELESGHPFLLVERLVVNSPAQGSRRLATAANGKNGQLRIQLQVAGFAKGRKPMETKQ